MDEDITLAYLPPKVKRNYRTGAFVSHGANDCDHVPAITGEDTVWDLYNNEARKTDNEMVNDWRGSLNSLLVFAAIFAAVLTAFIIESKKMLEQDQTQLLVSITVWNMNNMGNKSGFRYPLPEFEPTPTAISINCLLFASLGASLFAALASVVALQWIADYDAAIARGGSSAEDRAKRRQFRFAGIITWKMGEIIAALPLLLYSSVALFWTGAIQWMWMLHPLVGYVVAGGTGIAVLFYVSTTLIAACFVSAPFRTPLSRAIYWVYQLIRALLPWKFIFSIAAFIFALPFTPIVWGILSPVVLTVDLSLIIIYCLVFFLVWIVAWPILSADTFRSLERKIELWTPRPTWWMISAVDFRTKIFLTSRIKEFFVSWIQNPLIKWSNIHLRLSTARQREDTAANDDSALEQKSLIWLANQLPISADSNRQMDLLFTGVLDTLLESMQSSIVAAAPWVSIFEPLSGQFLLQILDSKLPKENRRHVGILVDCIERLKPSGKITHSSSYKLSPWSRNYWSQCCFSAEGLTNTRTNSSESMAFLLTRDIPIPSIDSETELEATIQFIKWRNLAGPKKVDIWIKMLAQRARYSDKYLDSCINSFKTFIRIDRTAHDARLWLSAQELEERRQQVLDIVEISDYLTLQDDHDNFHYEIVRLICDDMKQPDQDWPCSPDCPEDVCKRVAKIQDPCLAIIAAHACGIPTPIGARMTKAYGTKYARSIQVVQKFLCRKPLEDSELLWRLRAAVFRLWELLRV